MLAPKHVYIYISIAIILTSSISESSCNQNTILLIYKLKGWQPAIVLILLCLQSYIKGEIQCIVIVRYMYNSDQY